MKKKITISSICLVALLLFIGMPSDVLILQVFIDGKPASNEKLVLNGVNKIIELDKNGKYSFTENELSDIASIKLQKENGGVGWRIATPSKDNNFETWKFSTNPRNLSIISEKIYFKIGRFKVAKTKENQL